MLQPLACHRQNYLASYDTWYMHAQVGDSVAMTDMDVAAELVQLVWDEDEAAPATRLQPPITLQNMAAAEAQTAGSEKSPPSFSRQSAVISGELLADAAADPCDVNMCDRFDLDDGEVVCPEVALEEAVCIVFDDDADIPVLYEDEQLSSDQKRAGPRPVAAAQQQQLFAPKPTCGSHISTAVTPEAVGAVASAPVTIQLTPALRRPALVRRRQMYQMVADAAETGQRLQLRILYVSWIMLLWVKVTLHCGLITHLAKLLAGRTDAVNHLNHMIGLTVLTSDAAHFCYS